MVAAQLPKISIITVVRNGAATIEKAIRSVLDQQYPNFEYIIIDGGSSDGTVSIIEKYQAAISYWHSKPDKGAVDAINEGLRHATGDLIAYLFADDWYEPGTFIAIAEAYQKQPAIDIISCGGQIVTYNAEQQAYKVLRQFITREQLALTLPNICLGTPLISCRFISRSFIEKIGPFITFDQEGNNHISNDTEFLIRAITKQARHQIILHLGYTYLAHSNSTTFGRHVSTIKQIYRQHMEIAEQYLKKTNLTTSQKKFLNHWYCDQAIRLMLREWADKQWSKGLKNSMPIFKQRPVDYLRALIELPFTVALTRLFIKLNKLKNKQNLLKKEIH